MGVELALNITSGYLVVLRLDEMFLGFKFLGKINYCKLLITGPWNRGLIFFSHVYVLCGYVEDFSNRKVSPGSKGSILHFIIIVFNVS